MASERLDEEMRDECEARDADQQLRADQRADAYRDYPDLHKHRRRRISRWRAERRRNE